LYVKSNSIGRTPGLREFLSEITSENAWGEKGYLRTAGLITMSASERATYAAKLKEAGVSSAIAAPSSSPSSKTAAKKPASPSKAKKK
jgi:phosphate transport system substrate-binding protein